MSAFHRSGNSDLETVEAGLLRGRKRNTRSAVSPWGMNSSARKTAKSACADSDHRINWIIMELFGGLEQIAYISPVVMIDLVLYRYLIRAGRALGDTLTAP